MSPLDCRDMVSIEAASITLGLTADEAARLARELVAMAEVYWREEAPSPKGFLRDFDADAEYARRLEALQVSMPAHEVALGAYRIDRYPVTNGQWAAYLDACGGDPPITWSSLRTSVWEREFVTGVSWNEARAYARHHGLDLPTEAEWEHAARNGRSFFPWGDSYFPEGRAAFTPPTGAPWEVGSRPSLASWAGVHDLSGEFGEYCADELAPYPGADTPLFDRLHHGRWRGQRVIRGGFDVLQDSTCVFRAGIAPDHRDRLLKVRCVHRDPRGL
jgi:formylglycine-generating enzyme required for sulfatase activity